MAMYTVTDYGAKPDGKTLNTEAFAAAIRACEQGGGGTVYVPAGDYLTGPIRLCSNMTFYVEAGATIRFVTDFEAYPPVKTRWSGYEAYGYHPLLFGSGLKRVAIKGEGVIDGQGQAWWQAARKLRQGGDPGPYSRELKTLNRALIESVKSNILEWESQFFRPPLMQLIHCTDVVLEGITLQNSPFWNTHLVYCNHVNIRGVTFKNPSDTPNGDGLDIDSCQNVRVSDCHFDVGDDCLCLKSGIDEDGRRVGIPTENVAITNCTMLHGHGGVVMGSETAGGIRRVVISNCVFIGTDRGIRVKTNRARGGGVEDVQVSNIYMRDVLCPLAINAFYRWGVDESDPNMNNPEAVPITEGTPVVRNLTVSGITALNCTAAAAFVYGLPERPIENVSITHSRFEMTLDPNEQGGEPDMVQDTRIMAGDGMLFRHVRGLELHRVKIGTRQGPAIMLEQVEDAEIDCVRAIHAHPGVEPISIKDSKQVHVTP